MNLPNHPVPNDPRKVEYGPARQAVRRGEGITPSETYLAKLAERNFLNLWCYPNTFIDKKAAGKGDGKELCDLLVVCGDHVLIFSDKTVRWPHDRRCTIGVAALVQACHPEVGSPNPRCGTLDA
jgi:hypothetical protein